MYLAAQPSQPPQLAFSALLMLRKTRAIRFSIGFIWLLVAPLATAQSQDTLRVLFVGNSYIYYNNLPGIFEGIATSKGKAVEAVMHVRGGATLRRHVDEETAANVIQSGNWDYVVLQEQSTLSGRQANGKIIIGDQARFHAAARELDAVIREAGAQTMFMLTWARAFAPETQPDLTQAYTTIGHELNAPVAPVGPAWLSLPSDVQTFYHEDQSHPSATGSYLAAAVFYAMLFGESPVGATAAVDGFHAHRDGTENLNRPTTLVALTTETAQRLQEAAWATYQSFR